HGFGSVDGVQRGEDEMAGFRGFQCNLDRFAVTHFADENHFGSLTQRAAKGEGKSGRVAVQLALVNGGLFVLMQKLNGILDSEDVKGLFHVHFVDDCSDRGRFAGAGGAGHQDNAVFQLHDFFEARRQLEVIEPGNFVGDDAHHDGATAALAEDVDAKTADAGQAIGKVGGAVLIELVQRVLVIPHDVVGDGFSIG